MKRKHRVVVEITLDYPRTAKHARMLLEEILDNVDYVSHGAYKITCKEYERVLQAETMKLRHKLEQALQEQRAFFIGKKLDL